MKRIAAVLGLSTLLAGAAAPCAAQVFPTGDPVLKKIWSEGMDRSQVQPLAHALLDSIGPRLTGTPAQKAAADWAISTYAGWGITARNEQYGTWRGWRRGVSHLDLLRPRVRSLEAMLLAWSPGTKGRVEAPVLLLPDLPDSAAFARWLPQVKGKFVAVSFPPPTCRPDDNWEKFARPESFERMKAERQKAMDAWAQRLSRTGYTRAGTGGTPRDLAIALEKAGAVGILTNNWTRGWGADRIFDGRTQRIPTFDVSCEDYGLIARLAESGQPPVIRAEADAQELGEVPVFNTIAEIRGTEKPDEYVLLSAHFDSWDGGSGATDNGTGTVTMMEAMRILKAVYPNPKRTILVGHWNAEEQGLIGSRAFAIDHPDIVKGLQALFNQDNGTGRVQQVSMQGLTAAGSNFARWFSALPQEISGDIKLAFPGSPSGGGTDNASFVCEGAPAFSLGSLDWDYFTYTWHTQRDTYDKLAFDDVRFNAVLTAMLAYLASEDPETVARDRRVEMAPGRDGQVMPWPTCRTPPRSWAEAGR